MNRGHRPYSRSIRTYWGWFVVVALLVVPVVHVPARPGPAAAAHRPRRAHRRNTPRPTASSTATRSSCNPARGSDWKASILPKRFAKIIPSSPGARKLVLSPRNSSGGRATTCKLSFGNERLDDYGRYLAFVWDGDKMLNEELVRAGLARSSARLALQLRPQTPPPPRPGRGQTRQSRHLVDDPAPAAPRDTMAFRFRSHAPRGNARPSRSAANCTVEDIKVTQQQQSTRSVVKRIPTQSVGTR